ncbi:hypothetical protein AwPolaro_03360 [Polaromonas sp.]|nr:hypothetical protein AwPolaro_03360 [Polaromonas sp.]
MQAYCSPLFLTGSKYVTYISRICHLYVTYLLHFPASPDKHLGRGTGTEALKGALFDQRQNVAKQLVLGTARPLEGHHLSGHQLRTIAG